MAQRMVIGTDGAPLMAPSSTPTAILPTAPATPEHVILAEQVAALAAQLRARRLSDTDTMFVRQCLRTLGIAPAARAHVCDDSCPILCLDR
jgi:hypothetical protein